MQYIYPSPIGVSLQSVALQTATFGLLWFAVDVLEISCPLTTVGAAVTANIDGTKYLGPILPQLSIGNDAGYGALISGIALPTANPSHTALVVFAYLSFSGV
jgi:hypothetical protein